MKITRKEIAATLVDMWLSNPKMTHDVLYVRYSEGYGGSIETYSYGYGFCETPGEKPLDGFLSHPFDIRHKKDSPEYGVPRTILLGRVPTLFSIRDRGAELLPDEPVLEELTIEDLYMVLGEEETKKRLTDLFLKTECSSIGDVFVYGPSSEIDEEFDEEELVGLEWGGLTAREIAQACAAEWLNTYRDVWVSVHGTEFKVSSEEPEESTEAIYLRYDNGDTGWKQPSEFWRIWLNTLPADRFTRYLDGEELCENEIRLKVGEEEFRRRAELMFLTMLQRTDLFPYGIYKGKEAAND